jgi:hypothetical protein
VLKEAPKASLLQIQGLKGADREKTLA